MRLRTAGVIEMNILGPPPTRASLERGRTLPFSVTCQERGNVLVLTHGRMTLIWCSRRLWTTRPASGSAARRLDRFLLGLVVPARQIRRAVHVWRTRHQGMEDVDPPVESPPLRPGGSSICVSELSPVLTRTVHRPMFTPDVGGPPELRARRRHGGRVPAHRDSARAQCRWALDYVLPQCSPGTDRPPGRARSRLTPPHYIWFQFCL